MVAPTASIQRTVPSLPLPPLGARVEVIYDRRRLVGTVRFAGVTAFASGSLVGVALDSPIGKNDGSVMGMRYFDCAANHGLFVRPKAILSVEPPEDMSIAQVYNPEWSGMRYTPEPNKPQRRRVKALREVRKADQTLKGSTPRSKADWPDGEIEGKSNVASLFPDRSLQDEAWNKEGALKSPMARSIEALKNQGLCVTAASVTTDEQKESRATRMQSRGLEVFFNAIGRVTADVEDRAEQWFEDQGAESFADILRYGLEDSFTNALNLKIVQQKKAYAFWEMQVAGQDRLGNVRPAQLESGPQADQKSQQISAASGRAKTNGGSESQRAKMMAEILAPVLESNGFTEAAINDIVNQNRSDQSAAAGAKNLDWIRILSDIHATMAQLAESAANAEKQAAAAATAAAESEGRISEAIATVTAEMPSPPEAWLRAIMDRIDRCDASARESARSANEACERLQQRFEEIIAAADRDESPSPRSYLPEEPASWAASQQRAPARWPQATPSFTPPVRAAPQLYSDDELSPFYSSGPRGLVSPSSPKTPNNSFSPLVVPLSPSADIRVLAPEGLESPQNRMVSSRSPSPIPAMPVTMAVSSAPASVIGLSGSSSFPGMSGPSALSSPTPKLLPPVASLAASVTGDTQVPAVGIIKMDKPEAVAAVPATFGLPVIAVAEGANSNAMFGTSANQATSVPAEVPPVARSVAVVREIPAARSDGIPDLLQQPGSPLGLNLNANSKAGLTIRGEDQKRDDVSNELQQTEISTATVGVDLNNNGKVDVVITGEDRNRDGIPDVLQGSEARMAPVGLGLESKSKIDAIPTAEGFNSNASPPTATVGLDLNNNGQVDVVVTGEDRNRDGIPDMLQQSSSPLGRDASPPVATVGLDLNNNGQVDVVVTGEDRNCDGIPDVLQQSSSPVGRDTTPPTATVGLDLNNNGQVDVVVTGEDRNRDGIPDVLQQSTSPMGQDAGPPIATVGLDLNNNGKADVVISGEDRNRDGIPDVLQQPSSPLGGDATPPVATVGIDLNNNGQVDVVVTGEDRNRDGIPDMLQQSGSPLGQDASPPVATVGLDLNNNGKADVIITGEDRNRDGIPDVLQQNGICTAGNVVDLKNNTTAGYVVTQIAFAFENLDYDKVVDSPELTRELKRQVGDAIASNVKMPANSVEVELAKGSVLVSAAVSCVHEDAAKDVKRQIEVDGASLLEALDKSVTQIPKIADAIVAGKAGLGASGIKVSVKQPNNQEDPVYEGPVVITTSGNGVQDVRTYQFALRSSLVEYFERDASVGGFRPINRISIKDIISITVSDDAFCLEMAETKLQCLTNGQEDMNRWLKAWGTVLDLASCTDFQPAPSQAGFRDPYKPQRLQGEADVICRGSLAVVQGTKIGKPRLLFTRYCILYKDALQYFSTSEAKDTQQEGTRLKFSEVEDIEIQSDTIRLFKYDDNGIYVNMQLCSADDVQFARFRDAFAKEEARREEPSLQQRSVPDAQQQVLCSSPMEVQRGNDMQTRFLVLYNDRCDEFDKAKDHLKGAAPLTSINLAGIESFAFVDDGFAMTANGVEMSCRTTDEGSLARWSDAWNKLLDIDLESAEEQPQEILHEGPLGVVKKGGAKPQHFVLFANRFQYYASKEAFLAGEKPSGRLPFADITDFILNSQNLGFAIHVEEGRMHLRSNSSEEYAAWKKAWIEVLKKARPELPSFKEVLSRSSRESGSAEQDPVLFQGHLGVMKKNDVQQRYFALFKSRVEYWTSLNDFTQRLKSRGQISVQDVREVKILDDGFIFALLQGVVQLKVDSPADLESWIVQLGRVFKVVKDAKPDKSSEFASNESTQVAKDEAEAVSKAGVKSETKAEAKVQDKDEQPSSSLVCRGILGYKVTSNDNSSTDPDLSALGDTSRIGCPLRLDKIEAFETLGGAKGFIIGMAAADLELRALDSDNYYRWKEAWQGSLDFEDELGEYEKSMLAEEEDEEDEIVHQGSLGVMKRDGVVWKHFALFIDRLNYYASAADFTAAEQPSGHVKVDEIKDFTANDDNIAFTIGVEGATEEKFKKIALRAESREKFLEWKGKWARVMRTKNLEIARSLGLADAEESCLFQGSMSIVKIGGSEQLLHFVLFEDRLEYFDSAIDYTHGLQPAGQLLSSNVKELVALEDGFRFTTNQSRVQLRIQDKKILEWAGHMAWVFPCFVGNEITGKLGGSLMVLRGNDPQQRHFVIFDDRLEYYTSSEDFFNSLEPRGQLVFKSIAHIKVVGKEFHLNAPNGVVVLRAPGKRELVRWKAELAKVVTITEQEFQNRVYTLPSDMKTQYFVLYKDRLDNFADENEFNNNAKVSNAVTLPWKEEFNNADTAVGAVASAPPKKRPEEKEKSPSQAASDPNTPVSEGADSGAARTIITKGAMGVDKEGVLQVRYFVLYKGELEYWKSVEDYESGQAPRGNLNFQVFKECESSSDSFKFSSSDGCVSLKSRGGEDFEKWRDSLLKAGVLKINNASQSKKQSRICEGVLGVARSNSVSLRYFALYQDRLDYYNDIDIADIDQSQQDGRVYLSDIVSHKISDTEFKLQLSNGTLLLQPSNPADGEKWRNGWAQVLGGVGSSASLTSGMSNDALNSPQSTTMHAAQRAAAEMRGRGNSDTVVPQPAASNPSTVICEGTLGVNKQGVTESRYFVLTMEHLDYFLTEDAKRSGQPQRGRVVLDDVEDLNYGSYEFTLVLTQGSMQLIANGKADFEKWKDAWSQIFDLTS